MTPFPLFYYLEVRYKVLNEDTYEKKKQLLITIIAVLASIFHIYTGYAGVLLAMYQRSIHLGFMLALSFLMLPAIKNKKFQGYTNKIDVLFAVISVLAIAYLVSNYNSIVYQIGNPTQTQIIIGTIVTILVLEMVRRSCGLALFLVAVIGIAYAMLGPYMPAAFIHRGYSISRIASYLFMTTEGIFGLPLGVSATFIILFIIFGELLNATGAGDFFMDLAYSLTAWARGGPAKSAVVASAFFGTISGSAVANVTTTGTFTIPLMKRTGYSPVFAAAVEAVASTGGLITPPVMGAAAFLMAEMLNVPYIKIVIAAIIPALLYYSSLFFALDLQARKLKLKGIPRAELKGIKEIFFSGFEFFIPIIVLVYFLTKMWSPAKSVTISMIVLVIISYFRPAHRLTIKSFLKALENGAKAAMPVAAACASAGIIIGVVTMTGLGLRLTSAIIELSGGILPIALILTMITSLILGMGMPSTAAYIILAVLCAPALVGMGVPKLAAHFFIFYFGVISNITPPVALAAYAAAAIANANAMKVGWKAVNLGLVAFIVPYMFVYGPPILMQGKANVIILSLVTALFGAYALAISVTGWLFRPLYIFERAIYIACSISLIKPGVATDLIGLVLLSIMIIIAYKTRDRKKEDMCH